MIFEGLTEQNGSKADFNARKKSHFMQKFIFYDVSKLCI